eukprot:15430999-Alexandrium_andersonii.AAC.1
MSDVSTQSRERDSGSVGSESGSGGNTHQSSIASGERSEGVKDHMSEHASVGSKSASESGPGWGSPGDRKDQSVH